MKYKAVLRMRTKNNEEKQTEFFHNDRRRLRIIALDWIMSSRMWHRSELISCEIFNEKNEKIDEIKHAEKFSFIFRRPRLADVDNLRANLSQLLKKIGYDTVIASVSVVLEKSDKTELVCTSHKLTKKERSVLEQVLYYI